MVCILPYSYAALPLSKRGSNMTYLYIILLLFCQQEKYSVEKRCFNYDMPTFLLKKSQIMTTKNSLTFKIRLFFYPTLPRSSILLHAHTGSQIADPGRLCIIFLLICIHGSQSYCFLYPAHNPPIFFDKSVRM